HPTRGPTIASRIQSGTVGVDGPPATLGFVHNSPGGDAVSRSRWPLCALLLTATAAVYLPVLRCGFVTYDDPFYVSENPVVLRGLTRDGIVWAFTPGRGGNWHPLTWISHMLDCTLFGAGPGLHHLSSLALHLANVALLFLLLDAMTGARLRAAFVSALFALHPLHVESVAWISERKDLLSTLFLFLALAAYLRYARRPAPGRYLVVVLAF